MDLKDMYLDVYLELRTVLKDLYASIGVWSLYVQFGEGL